jgi:hypothetical protein
MLNQTSANMSVGKSEKMEDDNVQCTKQDRGITFPSTLQEPADAFRHEAERLYEAEHLLTAQDFRTGGTDFDGLLTPPPERTFANVVGKLTPPNMENKLQLSVRVRTAKTDTSSVYLKLTETQYLPPRTIVNEVLRYLSEVEGQMDHFRKYITTQNDEDIPLYQWTKYGGYPSLNTAVSELEKSTTKLKRIRLPEDYLTVSISQAMESSIQVSKIATYGFSVMDKKTAEFLEEMESSTMSEEARSEANTLIIKELQKLMEHSFRAAKHVWLATDLLRGCKHKSSHYKDWAWSSATTIVTAFIAATVSIVTGHLYGHSGFDLKPSNNPGGDIYAQVLDMVQRTQAVTNLTGELYTIKLQDIDRRYDNLADLSEAHGLRIDNLVEALGPPNQVGTYSVAIQKTDQSACKDLERIIQQVSEGSKRQSQRHEAEIKLMRKNINRMDIRLSSSIYKNCRG